MNENLFSFSAISGQGEQPKFDSTAFDLGSDVNAPPPLLLLYLLPLRPLLPLRLWQTLQPSPLLRPW